MIILTWVVNCFQVMVVAFTHSRGCRLTNSSSSSPKDSSTSFFTSHITPPPLFSLRLVAIASSLRVAWARLDVRSPCSDLSSSISLSFELCLELCTNLANIFWQKPEGWKGINPLTMFCSWLVLLQSYIVTAIWVVGFHLCVAYKMKMKVNIHL